MAEKYKTEDYPYFEDTHRSADSDGSFLPPTSKQRVVPREYQNVLVYEPKVYTDVQTLIDYLKRKEPAIINLDGLDPPTAQRILDFTSGAVYALNGSVLRIAGNIFLLSPEGVGVTVPHEFTEK